MTNEKDPDQPPAVAEAVLDATSLDEAIERVTTAVSSESVSRSGIRRLRVLSESKLEKLVYDLVAARVRARLKKNEGSKPASHEERTHDVGSHDGNAHHDDATTHYAALWKCHREKQLSRLRDLEARIEKIGATFTKLEDSVEQVLNAVSKRAT